MTKRNSPPIDSAELRRVAVEQLGEKSEEDLRLLEDPLRLLHELQVHQIELEMQNAELLRTREYIETALDKYTELYDFAPNGYLSLDRDGTIRELNFTGADLLGYERSQLIGQRISHFVATADRDAFSDFLAAVFIDQDKKVCEVTLLNKRKQPIIVQAEAVTAASGQECRVALIDISERKSIEDKLRTSERQLAEAQRSAHLGSWQWDSIADVITGSEEFYRIFGGFFSTYEDFVNLVHPDDRESVNKAVQDTLDRQLPYDIYYRIVQPDGTIRVIHAQGQAITNESGTVVRMIGTAQDVTERRANEDALLLHRNQLEEINHSLESRIVRALEELRQKDQMLILQDRLAVMGEMINYIAHQWRQPLNTLGLVIQQLPVFYGTDIFSREFVEESSANAMMQVHHMSKTIDDFKDFVKTNKSRVTFEVKQVVDNTLSLIEKSFQEHKINFSLHTEGEPQIYGCPNEFAQVLLIVILNALDALVEHAVDKPLISIHVFAEGSTSVVTITDNGRGISEEILDRIFDSYFTTKGPDKGTGIGLYMAKTIIEKNMGGRLSVRNTSSGAEFRIECNADCTA